MLESVDSSPASATTLELIESVNSAQASAETQPVGAIESSNSNQVTATTPVGPPFESANSAQASAQTFAAPLPPVIIPPPPTLPSNIFSPPVVFDVPTLLPETRGAARHLFKWYKPRARGRTVLKEDGVYRTVDTPTISEVNAADIAYLGGHVYQVSDEEADSLRAAGYDVL